MIVVTDNTIIRINYSERRNKIDDSYTKFYFMSMGAELHLFKTNLTKSSKSSKLGFSILYPEGRESERQYNWFLEDFQS